MDRTIAFVTNTSTHFQNDMLSFSKCDIAAFEKNVILMTISGSIEPFPGVSGREVNYLYPLPLNLLDEIYIGHSFTLYNTEWSYAYISMLLKSLVAGGKMYLPYYSNKVAKLNGYLSYSNLADRFSPFALCLKESGDTISISNVKANLLNRSSTILEWFFDQIDKLLCHDVLLGKQQTELTQEYINRYTANVLAENHQIVLSARENNFWRSTVVNLENSLVNHVYYVGGIKSKAAGISRIISDYFPKSRNALSVVDQGGGYGLLGMELLLDPANQVYKARCCDISIYNALVAANVKNYLFDGLDGKEFDFVCSASQDYEYDDFYDAVLFVGSLLYVPKQKLRKTLDRSWAALNTGGILVVHENIKNSSYTTDFDIMFEPEELDEILGSYGFVQHYLTTAAKPISANIVARKTAFRVVAKK